MLPGAPASNAGLIYRSGLKWFDAFFLCMLLVGIAVVSFNWHLYAGCSDPVQALIISDYVLAMSFRALQFMLRIANLPPLPGDPDPSARVRATWDVLRAAFLVLLILLWPAFLCVTIYGVVVTARSEACLPQVGQAYGLYCWLAFSLLALAEIARLMVVAMFRAPRLGQFQSHRGQFQRPDAGLGLERVAAALMAALDPEALARVLPEPPPPAAMRRMSSTARPVADVIGLSSPGRMTRRTGLCRSQRSLLPTFRLSSKQEDPCSVCLEDLAAGDVVRCGSTTCSCVFHKSCVDSWLRRTATCPRCRQPALSGREIAIHRATSSTTVTHGRDESPTSRRRRRRRSRSRLPDATAGGVGASSGGSAAAPDDGHRSPSPSSRQDASSEPGGWRDVPPGRLVGPGRSLPGRDGQPSPAPRSSPPMTPSQPPPPGPPPMGVLSSAKPSPRPQLPAPPPLRGRASSLGVTAPAAIMPYPGPPGLAPRAWPVYDIGTDVRSESSASGRGGLPPPRWPTYDDTRLGVQRSVDGEGVVTPEPAGGAPVGH